MGQPTSIHWDDFIPMARGLGMKFIPMTNKGLLSWLKALLASSTIVVDWVDQRHIRLRTAGGSQLLLDDTNEIVYVINSPGTAWVELAKDGSINVFSDEDLNMRATSNVNIRADDTVNIDGGKRVNKY